MKNTQIKIGRTYSAKVSGSIQVVRITGERRDSFTNRTKWDAVNVRTNRAVTIKSAQRLRSRTVPCLRCRIETRVPNDVNQEWIDHNGLYCPACWEALNPDCQDRFLGTKASVQTRVEDCNERKVLP